MMVLPKFSFYPAVYQTFSCNYTRYLGLVPVCPAYQSINSMLALWRPATCQSSQPDPTSNTAGAMRVQFGVCNGIDSTLLDAPAASGYGTHQMNSGLKPACCCSCKQAETERTRNDLDGRNLASNDMLSAADKLGVC